MDLLSQLEKHIIQHISLESYMDISVYHDTAHYIKFCDAREYREEIVRKLMEMQSESRCRANTYFHL